MPQLKSPLTTSPLKALTTQARQKKRGSHTVGVLQLCWHLPPLTTKAKQTKSIEQVNMNQRLKITNLIGHIKKTIPNGLLKISKFLVRSTPTRNNQRVPVG